MVKHLFLVAALLVLFMSKENAAARSAFYEDIEKASGGLAYEKPKPGTKRWQRKQRNVRNTRRNKYPRMRRNGKQQANWTMYVAAEIKAFPETEQNGLLVVDWGAVKIETTN